MGRFIIELQRVPCSLCALSVWLNKEQHLCLARQETRKRPGMAWGCGLGTLDNDSGCVYCRYRGYDEDTEESCCNVDPGTPRKLEYREGCSRFSWTGRVVLHQDGMTFLVKHHEPKDVIDPSESVAEFLALFSEGGAK